MKPLRVYADTPVFGGCFDAEFAAESKRFLALVRAGRVKLLVSEVVVRELAKAPTRVLELLRSLPADCVEQIRLTRDMIYLRAKQEGFSIPNRRTTRLTWLLPLLRGRTRLGPGTSNISCELTRCGLSIG